MNPLSRSLCPRSFAFISALSPRFFTLITIRYPLSAIRFQLVPSTHDHAGRALVVTRLLTLGLPTPRRNRMRITLTRFAFAAAVRMIDGIHHDTANGRTNAHPALDTGLSETAQVVLVVADFTDRRAAFDVHFAHFA